MIASKLVPGRRLSATENAFSVVVNSKSLDRKVLEGLELAQCEVFLAIKVRSYTVAKVCLPWSRLIFSCCLSIPHKQTRTRTLTHKLSLSLSNTHTRTHVHTQTLSHTLSVSLSFSLSLSLDG